MPQLLNPGTRIYRDTNVTKAKFKKMCYAKEIMTLIQFYYKSIDGL